MGPTTADKQERAQEIVDELLGTCKALYEVLDEWEMDDLVILGEIDDQIFLCDECGWWCEICEHTEDGRCNECNPETEEY